MEAERYQMSNRQVSSICTALLVDLGIITEDNIEMTIDKGRIFRAREKIRREENERKDIKRTLIEGIMYDGRKDETLVRNEASGGIRTEKEEHFCVIRNQMESI